MRGTLSAVVLCAALLQGCSRKEEKPPSIPSPAPTAAAPSALTAARVTLIDAQDRPVRDVRLAKLSDSAFDAQGRLREEAVARSPERLRVVVEDPFPGAPATLAVSTGSSGPPFVLPLSGPPARRMTRPFLLLGDREDAAAGAGIVLAGLPGGAVELRYRDGVAARLPIGPAAVYEIPVRFVAVGSGLPSIPEIERSVDLRLAQANAVWEPFGRRFKRGSIARLEACRGLLLIRGRAAGADGQGRPSRCGMLLDGKEISVPAAWRNDGAPMTPKATARALSEKIARTFQVDAFGDLLAGDREAVVLRVRRRDGTPATVERLAEGNDVAQALTPLPSEAGGGVEAAPSGALLSLEELAILASGRGTPADGFEVFIVSSLRAFGARPAYKVYPDGSFPASLSGSALVSWTILDGSGAFPYGLARVAGELLLPPGVPPAPDDTLFADPLSEAPGVTAHKRVTAATGLKIAERGRGLAGKK
jgi:hypothetical protein